MGVPPGLGSRAVRAGPGGALSLLANARWSSAAVPKAVAGAPGSVTSSLRMEWQELSWTPSGVVFWGFPGRSGVPEGEFCFLLAREALAGRGDSLGRGVLGFGS